MAIDYAKKFNDRVAGKTSWQPLKKGGASFGTYRLVHVSASRIEFRATWYAILFYIIFMAIGLGLLLSSLFNLYINDFHFEYFEPLYFIIGTLFFLAGLFMAKKNITPVVFDKTYGYFWKGYKKPHYSNVHKMQEIFQRMHDIHALQLIAELVKGDKRSYYSYELNIIYYDGSRKNVVDHGNIEKLKKEAEELARFINRPLWSLVG